jgi:hypothetical protein
MSSKRSDLEVPKQTHGDTAHTTLKAAIAAIPYVGGTAAELFSKTLLPPLERLREEWMEAVALELTKLTEQVKELSMDDLVENEMFVSTLMHATRLAVSTHQGRKLQALQNAILNAAMPNSPEDDLQMIFLNLVDILTVWHLKILDFFDDPQSSVESQTNWKSISPFKILTRIKYAELEEKEDLVDHIIRDLNSRGLLTYDLTQLRNADHPSQALMSRTTPMAKQFLDFLKTPIVDEQE